VVGDCDGDGGGVRSWNAVRRALYAVRRTDGGGVMFALLRDTLP